MQDLLSLAPPAAVAELRALDHVAEENLYPHLAAMPSSVDPREGALVFGATFAASDLCSADADVFGGGTMIELKTKQGAMNSRGVRVDTLSRLDVLQMLGYVSFDTADTYRLDTVALYSARYGRYVSWPLAGLLELAAGRPLYVERERRHVWELLGSS